MEQSKELVGTIAFPFAAGSTGSALVLTLQEVCVARGLLGNPPKMGPHATVIPPFVCSEREMNLIAVVLRAMWKWKPGPVWMEAKRVDVFSPPKEKGDVGTIYVEVEVPREYHEFIEKHKLGWPLPFVHRPAMRNPADRVWIPHASVLEGKHLHTEAIKHLPALNEYVYGKCVEFFEPHVFRKYAENGETWWEKVLV